MLKFHYRYFAAAILLLVTEVVIALFVHDKFIRPHVGDFLVVILIYCFLRAFLNTSVWRTAILVLLFSYAVEMLQYFRFVEKIGLHHSKMARVIIGTSFSWIDILAYTLGIGFVIIVEKSIAGRASA